MFHPMVRSEGVRFPAGLLPTLYLNLENALRRANRRVESLAESQRASASEKASLCSRLELQERKEEESAAQISRLKESLKLKEEEMEAARRRSRREHDAVVKRHVEEKEVERRRARLLDDRFRALVRFTEQLNQREREIKGEMEELEERLKEDLAETEEGLRASCRALVRMTGGRKKKASGWKRKEQEMKGEKEKPEVSFEEDCAEREQSLKTVQVDHKKEVEQRETEVRNGDTFRLGKAGEGGGLRLSPLPPCPASIFYGRVLFCLFIFTFVYWFHYINM